MQFEKNLVLLRKKNNLSQEELAFAIGVSRQTIYTWEAGLNYPNIVMLRKIADVLNVTTDDLLNGFEVNRLPAVINDFKLTFVRRHDGEVRYEELPNWFVRLRPEEEVCWALYDLRNGKLVRDYSYHVMTRGNALIHDREGIEIEVKEYNEELSLRRVYSQFISVKDEGVAWLGESTFRDGKRIIKTFKDQDFLDNWGIGGRFEYQQMNYNEAEDWSLEYNGRKQNVIKISYYDPDGRDDPKAAYFEAFLNQNLETLVWRRYTKVVHKNEYSNETIVIDGQTYDMDYYSLTSRL